MHSSATRYLTLSVVVAHLVSFSLLKRSLLLIDWVVNLVHPKDRFLHANALVSSGTLPTMKDNTDAEDLNHHQQLQQYTSFLNETLRPNMEALKLREQLIQEEIEQYDTLRTRVADLVAQHQQSLQVESVDLGHGKLSCAAEVADTSHIFVHVGMGFHAELTLPEAVQFCQKRIGFLRYNVLKQQVEKISKVAEHIKSTETILDEIASLRQQAG